MGKTTRARAIAKRAGKHESGLWVKVALTSPAERYISARSRAQAHMEAKHYYLTPHLCYVMILDNGECILKYTPEEGEIDMGLIKNARKAAFSDSDRTPFIGAKLLFDGENKESKSFIIKGAFTYESKEFGEKCGFRIELAEPVTAQVPDDNGAMITRSGTDWTLRMDSNEERAALVASLQELFKGDTKEYGPVWLEKRGRYIAFAEPEDSGTDSLGDLEDHPF